MAFSGTKEPICISVVDGDLSRKNDHQYDVIVNTTNPLLLLEHGVVTKAILTLAGLSLQEECSTKYPNGIKSGDVARTGGHGMGCKEIFHVTLQSFGPETKKTLKDLVTKCLQEASSSGYTSIAFPALGTGRLMYPPDEVSAIMKETVDEFETATPGTCLKNIAFVIYKDSVIQQAFEKSFSLTIHDRITPPAHWAAQDPGEQVKLVPLAKSDPEYQRVETYFRQTLLDYGVAFKAVSRIQNPVLYGQYGLKKMFMEKQNGPLMVNEKTLWHGTSVDCLNSINHYGFNRSFCGKNATHFGLGVYFAIHSVYSTQEKHSTTDVTTGSKYIYQCKVLVGHTTRGYSTTKILPPRKKHILFDSACDSIANPLMYVIFNDTQAYPEYLIKFKFI